MKYSQLIHTLYEPIISAASLERDNTAKSSSTFVEGEYPLLPNSSNSLDSLDSPKSSASDRNDFAFEGSVTKELSPASKFEDLATSIEIEHISALAGDNESSTVAAY